MFALREEKLCVVVVGSRSTRSRYTLILNLQEVDFWSNKCKSRQNSKVSRGFYLVFKSISRKYNLTSPEFSVIKMLLALPISNTI
jgi:hypothetical protein